MTLSLITTAGSQDANAYVDLPFIADYAVSTIWSAAWQAIVDDDVEVASGLVVRATRYFDQLTFPGQMTTRLQALQWPRIGVFLADGSMVDTDVIPVPIQRASAHLVAYLAGVYGVSVDPFMIDPTAKFEAQQIGPINTTYRVSIGPEGNRILDTIIAPMLIPYRMLGPSGVVRLVR